MIMLKCLEMSPKYFLNDFLIHTNDIWLHDKVVGEDICCSFVPGCFHWFTAKIKLKSVHLRAISSLLGLFKQSKSSLRGNLKFPIISCRNECCKRLCDLSLKWQMASEYCNQSKQSTYLENNLLSWVVSDVIINGIIIIAITIMVSMVLLNLRQKYSVVVTKNYEIVLTHLLAFLYLQFPLWTCGQRHCTDIGDVFNVYSV